ncbi:Alpha/Beta hydrolase protein [Infundibulicybe gibba]|nr:Alpha/Beta hydrolase protein [Infundibulicybe gibba]
MIHVEDKQLALPDGRVLAYADNGNTSSTTLVLFLHGAFGVGDASRPPNILIDKNVHVITPSLPGWGKSSPVPAVASYSSTVASDLTHLITYLHPKTSALKLYICGHSFGTVIAQMLYGAPYDIFPPGERIAALVLLAPFSPPHCHRDYAKTMSWSSYFMAGPPTRYIPFDLVPRVRKIFLARRLLSEPEAQIFARQCTLDGMDDSERETFVKWQSEHGVEDGQFERELGAGMFRSVAKSWRGFLDITSVYHSTWGGYYPDQLDEQHAKPPVLLVTARNDQVVPGAMAQWLAHNLKFAMLKTIDGGHYSAFFHMEEIWKEVLD